MSKLVFGVGINNKKYPCVNNKITVKEYAVWQSMLLRCYKSKAPSYAGCTVSENFKSYSFFYEWCNKQIGFKSKDIGGNCWHLDKDLLVKGNKLYSEDNCVFLPPDINYLLTKRNTKRGEFPIGVSWHKNNKTFCASCSTVEIDKHLGSFKTPEQAFQAYKIFKEAYIKQVAEQYKSQIDPRAYKALLEYEVNIDD